MKIIVISYEGAEASTLTQKALINVLIARGICDGNGHIHTLDEADIAKLVATHCLEVQVPTPKQVDVNDAITFLLNIFANEQKADSMFFTKESFIDSIEELLDNPNLPEVHKANLISALHSIASQKKSVHIRKEYIPFGFNINSVRLIKKLCERRKL